MPSKNPMKRSSEYAQLVAKADQAVASVRDPILKLIAFQRVLDDLLVNWAPVPRFHQTGHTDAVK